MGKIDDFDICIDTQSQPKNVGTSTRRIEFWTFFLNVVPPIKLNPQ